MPHVSIRYRRPRFFVFLFITLAFCLTYSAAWALDYPIDPFHAQRQPFPLPSVDEEAAQRREAGKFSISISIPSNIETGKEVFFFAGVSGSPTEPCSYQYEILSMDPDSTEVYGREYLQYNYLMQDDNTSDSPWFSYTFYEPGTYYFCVTVTDADGVSVKYNSKYDRSFQVNGDDLLAARMDEIADECLQNASTDFEKALWLHDWLISHADYDYDYSRYTTEGVIIHGSGVCDSYRHAYKELLARVGVSATAVTSTSHAWNLVCMDGTWYNVDCTWDDPNEGDVGTDALHHLFFGLPDELIHRVRSHTPDRTPKHTCVSYDYNYAYYTGTHSIWTDPVLEKITQNTNDNVVSMYLNLRSWIETESEAEGMIYPILYYGITAYAFQQAEWEIRGYPVELFMEYSLSQPLRMWIYLRYDRVDPEGMDQLLLPPSITEIREEAFAGTDIQLVQIPDHCTVLEARAFADCERLREISIPESVTSIAEDCFEDAGDFVLIAPTGSYAAQFAETHSLRFRVD